MTRPLIFAVILLSLGCGGSSSDGPPMRVGRSYQIRMSHAPDVAQVRVIDRRGNWVHVRFHPNSPQLETGHEEVWVNESSVVFLLPYQ